MYIILYILSYLAQDSYTYVHLEAMRVSFYCMLHIISYNKSYTSLGSLIVND